MVLAVLAYVEIFPNGWTDLLAIAITAALTIVTSNRVVASPIHHR